MKNIHWARPFSYTPLHYNHPETIAKTSLSRYGFMLFLQKMPAAIGIANSACCKTNSLYCKSLSPNITYSPKPFPKLRWAGIFRVHVEFPQVFREIQEMHSTFAILERLSGGNETVQSGRVGQRGLRASHNLIPNRETSSHPERQKLAISFLVAPSP